MKMETNNRKNNTKSLLSRASVYDTDSDASISPTPLLLRSETSQGTTIKYAKPVFSFALGVTTGSLTLAYLWHSTNQVARHHKKGLPITLMLAPMIVPAVIAYAIKDRQRFNWGAIAGVCVTWLFTDVLFNEEDVAIVAVPILLCALVGQLINTCRQNLQQEDAWLECEEEDGDSEDDHYVIMGGYRNGGYRNSAYYV